MHRLNISISMKSTEILEKIRLTFNELVNTPKQEQVVKMIEATLMDGTKVEVTELAIGGIVTIDGVPAPAGEHTLSDGTMIVLGDNGAIMEIMPAEVEVEIEAKKKDDEMMNSFSAFQTSTNEKFASYESKFANYEQKFADYETRLNKATQVIEGLLNLTQTLAETPTGVADVAVKSESKFSKSDKEFKYDILFS
jgi:hypothetical protein